MPISDTNNSPRSLDLLRTALPSNQRFVLADIGARGGVVPEWKPLGDMASVIAFDPDEDACGALADESISIETVPCALASHPGEKAFYLTELEYCHGFMPCNYDYLGRFPNAVNCKVRDCVTLQADSLDNVLGQLRHDHVDFMKIDTEGSELDVLQGARKAMHDFKTLGLLVEVWWDPRLKGQPAFADLDTFIRDQGFTFFDIECQRYPRSTLPVGRMRAVRSEDGQTTYSCEAPYRHHGQILTADALYFRDPIWDLSQESNEFSWNDETILRLVGLLDLYNYQDVAIELLDFYRDRFTKPIDADLLIDSLVPDIDGKILPFDQYWDLSAKLFSENYLLQHIRPKLRLARPRYRRKV
jgi:FkbM family methyltransferase